MPALTNTAIDTLQQGRELKDDRVPGLSVRANARAKSFMLYYRTRDGQVRRPKIGDYGVLSIADARSIAKKMLVKVAAGEDPSKARKVARQDPTMDDLWTDVEKHHYNHGNKWDGEAKRLWEKNIKPLVGKLRVAEVQYDDVQRVFDAIAKRPTTANRVTAILSKMLHLAEKWNMRPLGSNPCRFVVRAKETSRRRYASPVELKRLGPILDAEISNDPTGVAFLYVLLFSGARPSEIERTTPGQVERVVKDEKTYGVLRIENGKTGVRDVFLPPQAMKVLDALPAKRDTLTGRRHLPRKLWARVRKAAGCADLWARDCRRTFATVAYSSGVSADMVGDLLGHASVQTTKVYAKLLEDPAHRAAAGTADLMEALLKEF